MYLHIPSFSFILCTRFLINIIKKCLQQENHTYLHKISTTLLKLIGLLVKNREELLFFSNFCRLVFIRSFSIHNIYHEWFWIMCILGNTLSYINYTNQKVTGKWYCTRVYQVRGPQIYTLNVSKMSEFRIICIGG